LYCALAGFHPFLATAWGEDVIVEARTSRIFHALGRLTIRAADAVIVDSEVLKKGVLDLGCSPSKIYCFPRGIDPDRFRPQESTRLRRQLGWASNKIVVSTRNHFPIYGLENLIRAIPLILERVANARFLIAGDGPLLEYHKSLTRELAIEDRVKFLGRVDNDQIPEVLNAGDAYVSTSFSDCVMSLSR
jgi:glycosyltransferase involved in cell wall biosynthesis